MRMKEEEKENVGLMKSEKRSRGIKETWNSRKM